MSTGERSITIHPPDALDRRSFCLGTLAAGLALACGGGGSGPTPVPVPPATGPKTTAETRAALLATPEGTTRDYRNLGDFFLIRDAAGIYAMTAVCTHMGCIIGSPVGTRITCPCHSSVYDLNGGNLVGPASAPLSHFAVSEATPGGVLIVNTAQVVAASLRMN